jgi:[ribosomal protein S5]-alanine N-acetyltransferase
MRLITRRLIIRETDVKDCKDITENINDLEVSRQLLLVPHPYSRNNANAWVLNCKKEAAQKPRTKYSFVIELKSEKKAIGVISLRDVDRFQGTTEIGYWLGRKYWRNGFMSEAVEALLSFCFDKLSLRRVNLNAVVENIPSNSLAKKFGFIYEGTSRKAVRSRADWRIHDHNHHGLLKEEWEAGKK